MNKPVERRGKILLINAVKEVTRKNAQSYLEDDHINHIASTYRDFKEEEGYAKVVTIEDVESQNYSLSIPLYIYAPGNPEPIKSLDECIDEWISQSVNVQSALQVLTDLL